MQTYLKTKPVWQQLLLFLGMAFGIFIVVSLIGSTILSAATGVSLLQMADAGKFTPGDEKILNFIRGMLLLQFLGLFVIPSLLFAYFSHPRPLQYLGLQKPFRKGYWPVAIVLLVLALPLVEYTGTLNRNINFGNDLHTWAQGMEEEAAKTVRFMLGTHSVSDLVLNLIFIAGFAAVGEELFFRGVLQRLFIKGTKNAWMGIVLAAFFFSFFHFQFFGFIPRFLLGTVLGAIYWYSGSLYAAIAAHFVYDAFIIVLAYFNPQMVQNPDAPMLSPAYIGLAALASAAVVGALIWWMKRASSASFQKLVAEDNDDDHNPNHF